MLSRVLAGLALGLVACAACAADTAPPSVETFFSNPQISDVKISPDGKYLALAVIGDQGGADRTNLVILTTVDKKPQAKFSFIKQQSILDFWWANDERVLIATQTRTGSFDSPLPDGQLYGIDADGNKQVALMGMSNRSANNPDAFTHVKHTDTVYYFTRFISIVPDDPKRVIVEAVVEGGGMHQLNTSYLLDIYSGATRPAVTSPVTDGEILADDSGAVRAAWGNNQRTGFAEYFVKADGGKGDWDEVKGLANGDDPGVTPLQFMGTIPDSNDLYWFGRTPTGTVGLFSLDPATSKQQSLFGDPDNDLEYDIYFDDYQHDGAGLIWSFDYAPKRHVIAVETMPGLPAVHILDGDDAKAQILGSLYDAFSGQHVEISSNTRDGSQMIVHVTSDKNPGDFYLFDAKTNKADLLFSSKPDIDPAAMASMQPISFKTRDGLVLHGYLTTPAGLPAKNLPMVLLVHGGPHQIRDTWGWNPEVQFFAAHGYAVLQVNYRGSGGYGMKFQDLGYAHWGSTMQDDLADGVRWAEQQGVADPKRVCIYGASYGGYAALENPILYPDLYKCAVGYVGAYDLTLLGHSGGAQQSVASQDTYDVFLGKDMEARKQASPVYGANKLKLPVLIIYGGADQNVVPQHAKEMLAAMDKAGVKHPSPIYEPTEGHGFFDQVHVIPLYTQMLAFIDANIGPTAPKN